MTFHDSSSLHPIRPHVWRTTATWQPWLLNIRYPLKAFSAHCLVTTAWCLRRLQLEHTILFCPGRNKYRGSVPSTLLHHRRDSNNLIKIYQNEIKKSGQKSGDVYGYTIIKKTLMRAIGYRPARPPMKAKRAVMMYTTQHILRTLSVPPSRLPWVNAPQ